MTDQITRAFKILRKHGYFAAQDWACCQSCGQDEIPDNKKDKYVFYHGQDATDLWETGETYLNWDGDADHAKFICDTFKAAGLEVEHNGDANTRILIRLPKDAKRPRPSWTNEELEKKSQETERLLKEREERADRSVS
jgi:uncharacterized protein YyaL (SSP411 family)